MGRLDLPLLTVVIVTYERPQFLERCLDALALQGADVHQVVVVDASGEGLEPRACADLPQLSYIHAPELAGHMTRSRNRALLHAQGDVISFLDDDVVVHPGWALSARRAFRDEDIDALAGRTIDGIEGEDAPTYPVGTLASDGRLTAGFAAATGGRVRVTHGIGANMSFSREILCRLGGFRDDYPGTALREDTDIFLRIAQLGGAVVFDPDVTVDHLPAPHVRGRRFDTRYKLYGRRNHMVLLARNNGIAGPLLWRWVVGQYKDIAKAPGLRRRAERFGVTTIGVAWGFMAVVLNAQMGPMRAERENSGAEAIRTALATRGA